MEDLGDEGGRRGGGEDEAAEVGGALVAQGGRGVDEGPDAVALEGGADEGGAPGGDGGGGLAGLDELLLGVGELCALVGLAEDGAQDGQLDAVVEDEAEGDGRGLDGGEVCTGFNVRTSLLSRAFLSSLCSSSNAVIASLARE